MNAEIIGEILKFRLLTNATTFLPKERETNARISIKPDNRGNTRQICPIMHRECGSRPNLIPPFHDWRTMVVNAITLNLCTTILLLKLQLEDPAFHSIKTLL